MVAAQASAQAGSGANPLAVVQHAQAWWNFSR